MKYFIPQGDFDKFKEVSYEEWERFFKDEGQVIGKYGLRLDILQNNPPIVVSQFFTGMDEGDGMMFESVCHGEEIITKKYLSYEEMNNDYSAFLEKAKGTSIHDDMERIRKMMGG